MASITGGYLYTRRRSGSGSSPGKFYLSFGRIGQRPQTSHTRAWTRGMPSLLRSVDKLCAGSRLGSLRRAILRLILERRPSSLPCSMSAVLKQ